jgi:capsular polysaccharide biosynthesis protein
VSSLIAALLFAALGYASVIRRPAVYQSTAILLIDQPLSVAGASGEGVLRKLAALRVKYAVLARTRRLTTPVAEKLNISVAEVARSLVVSATGASLVVFVTARSAQPKRAQEIANASAEEIIKYTADENEANKVPPERRVIFTVIDPAFPGHKIEPTGERARLIAALAAALGFAAVFGVGQLFPKRSR